MNKIVIFLLSLGIVLATFVGIRYLKILDDIQSLSHYREELDILQDLNSKINNHFGKTLSLINQDEINDDTRNFDNNLSKLEKLSDKFENFDLNFEEIKAKFLHKKGKIAEFNALNKETILLIYQLKNSPALYQNEIFMLNYYDEIMLQNYENSNITEQNQIIKNYKSLNAIAKNIKSDLTPEINAIIHNFNEIGTKYYRQIKHTATIFCALLLFCLIFLLYGLIIMQKNSADLSTLRDMIQNCPCGVVVFDRNFLAKSANRVFLQSRGANLEDIIGLDFAKFGFGEEIRASLSSGRQYDIGELSTGNLMENVKILPLNIKNNAISYAAFYTDIADSKNTQRALHKKESELIAQSLTDNLTGYGNESALMEILKIDSVGEIISISVNNFANLSYLYNTNITEEIILNFAKTINLALDTYKIKARVFRLYLDEFCLFYTGGSVVEDTLRIKSYFDNKIFRLENDYFGTVRAPLHLSIGISLNRDLKGASRIYQAHIAKQEAKNKNESLGIYHTDNVIELRYQKNQQISNMIQRALNDNQVFVEVQAVHNTGFKNEKNEFDIEYYEILLRLRDENGNVHNPGNFLEIAKQTMLYIPLSEIVINECFALLEKFPTTKFSINLSTLDISNSTIYELFIKKLIESSYTHNLCVEILESEESHDYEFIANFIKLLKTKGVKIAIDDFGSGYSNYYRVLSLDVDYIKIDGDIIKNITKDEKAKAVVQTIVIFAKKQGYKVIAEHAGDIATIEMIRQMGIVYVQGFILSKPTSINSILS